MKKQIRINGTEAGTIMGDNPWRGLLELWQLKTGRKDFPDLTDKESVQWGIRLEPVILQQVMKNIFGEGTYPHKNHIQVWLESNQYGFPMTGFADYYDGKTLIEIKTANQYALQEWESGVPPNYYWQVLHYLIITGLPSAFIACLVGGQRLIIHRVQYDDDAAAELIAAERWFYNLILTDTEPPMPVIPPEIEANMDADVERIIPELLDVKEQMNGLKRREDELSSTLKALIGENVTQAGAFYRASYKYIETSRLDTKALAQAEPDVYEKFKKLTGYYRLDIKEIKP